MDFLWLTRSPHPPPLPPPRPLPPPGAVRAHHHAHHECSGEALRLPSGLSHLPVFLHADVSHPLLKFLHAGK